MLIDLLKRLILKGSWHYINKEPELARQAYIEAVDIITSVSKVNNPSILKYVNSKAAANTDETSVKSVSLSITANAHNGEDETAVSAQSKGSESFASRLEFEIEFSKKWILPFLRSLLLFVSDKKPKLNALPKNVHAIYSKIAPLFNAFQQMMEEYGKAAERDIVVSDEYAKNVLRQISTIESYYHFEQYNFLQIFKLMATEQLGYIYSNELNRAVEYSLEITNSYSNLAADFDELHAYHQCIIADKNSQQVTEHQLDQQTGQDRSSCPKEMADAMRKNAALFKFIYHQRNCKQLLEQDDLASQVQDKASVFVRAIKEFISAYNIDPAFDDKNFSLLLSLGSRMSLLSLDDIHLSEDPICADLAEHLQQFMKILESAINGFQENSDPHRFKLDIEMTIPELVHYYYFTASDLVEKIVREINHKKTVITDDSSQRSLTVDSEKSPSQQSRQSSDFEDLYLPLEPLSFDVPHSSDNSEDYSALWLVGMDEFPKVATNPDVIERPVGDIRDDEINPEDWSVLFAQERVISSAELKGSPLKAQLLSQSQAVAHGSRKNKAVETQSESAAHSPVKNVPASTQFQRVATTSSPMRHLPKRALPLMGGATGSPIKVAPLSTRSQAQSDDNSPTKIVPCAVPSKKDTIESPSKIAQLLNTSGLFGVHGHSRNGANASDVADRRSKKRGLHSLQNQAQVLSPTETESPVKRVTRSMMRKPLGTVNE